jgi:hypothetical protein
MVENVRDVRTQPEECALRYRYLTLSGSCLLALIVGAIAPSRAAAACMAIANVPFIIGSPGDYCVTADLASAQTSGSFITVTADNVTIDFQGHSLDNTAAGVSTQTFGVDGRDRHGITVRNGLFVGTYVGVHLDVINSSGDHLVEDNRFTQMRWKAIMIDGTNLIIRRNLVMDGGGGGTHPDGLSACENQFNGSVQAYNNTVVNIGTPADESPDGMMLYCYDSVAIGNRVVNAADSGISLGAGYCMDNVVMFTGRPWDPGLNNGCRLVGSTNYTAGSP